MDFDLPEELRILKDTLRRFVDAELIPIEREAYDGHLLKDDVRTHLEAKTKELGLWMFDVPEELGGMGMGALAKTILWEEIARSIAVPMRGQGIFGPEPGPILLSLTDETQRENYLYPVLRGEKRAAFMQTEPDAGGDPGGMRTTAVRDGDHYVINGSKRFITGAAYADFAQVIAVTDKEKGSRGGISAFLVDMNTPGMTVLREQAMMMDDRPCEVLLEDVRVPVENRIGEEGEGFKFGQHWITQGRMRHCARSMGVASRCLDLATSYSKQRVTFGEPLSNRQSIQWMLVDSWMEIEAARLLLHRTAWKFDRGDDTRYESYMIKVMGDETGFRVVDRCLQIHGGIGLSTDLPIEKFFRDQRGWVITEGPPEILRMVMARHVLRTFG